MGGSVSILFFPAVIVPAAYGFGPALLAAVFATASIAYFFIPPVFVFDFGIDDLIRLSTFSGVATTAAWLTARRKAAEAASLRSLRDLERHLQTVQELSGWPALIGPDPAASVRQLLTHAALIVRARAAAVLWEAEDEPWVYIASTAPGAVIKEPVSRLGEWRHDPPHPEIVRLIGDDEGVSATFDTEYVAGRLYFTGVTERRQDLHPTMSLIAHELGNSIGRLYLTDRMRQIAVHEDRIRVARDLHDGVLQGLTGVRLELQSIADSTGPAADRLRALERALAVEQRELRLFIEDLRPSSRALTRGDAIATRLQDMCSRLSSEWRIPITVRVTPSEMILPNAVEQAVRLLIHEGVSNALRHSHPSRVAVEVDVNDAELRVGIIDDGLGFSFRGRLNHDELDGSSTAPTTLRERVSGLGGRMSVESYASGSRIEFVIPVDTQQRITA